MKEAGEEVTSRLDESEETSSGELERVNEKVEETIIFGVIQQRLILLGCW
jgi:hypothetical protein